MSDLISRQAAIDALETIGFDFSDSDLSAVELEEVCEAVGDVEQEWLQRIKRLPSAQPEIVRCKYCKYGVVDDPEIPFLRFCEYNGQDWNDENHYCGHAERREVTDGRD